MKTFNSLLDAKINNKHAVKKRTYLSGFFSSFADSKF